MRAIVYAAGISARMNNFVSDGLKGLTKIDGNYLIEYQLNWLADYNLKEIVIVLGLEHQRYVDVLGSNYKNTPIRYIYNPDYKTKGNMLSLWHAREFCQEDTIFTTSDLLCSREDIDYFMSFKTENKILVDRKNEELFSLSDPVKVNIIDDRIVKIRKKLNEIKKVDGISIGIYKFSKSLMGKLLSRINYKIENESDNLSLYYPIDDVIKSSPVIPVYTKESKWLDVDTKEEYEVAVELIRTGKIKF